MRFNICLAALAATVVAASPAAAATTSATVNAVAKGTVLQPLTLAETTGLDFGTVIADPTASGTVTIDADGAPRATGGAVVGVPNYPGSRGVFQGVGTAGGVVQVSLTAPASLADGAGNIVVVTSLSLDSAGATRTIGAGGSFTVGVGGLFAIAGGQPSGTYTGKYSLTAQYQ